jgi:hypothetical protein
MRIVDLYSEENGEYKWYLRKTVADKHGLPFPVR